jgi:hypothetical protein
LALVLSLWIGLAPTLPMVTVAAAAPHMAGMTNFSPADCDCCPDIKKSNLLCILTCLHAPLWTVPSGGDVPTATLDGSCFLERKTITRNRIAPPDPPPPRRQASA